ncbi:MAG: hypothetical protein KAY24_19110, partial [Candidatus Eisenbacteria sp.]|nr:hypothetical protein [Candidatus Eisenbacteria bacterium]
QYLRPYLQQFITRFMPQVVILSYVEAGQATRVQTVATVKAEDLLDPRERSGGDSLKMAAAASGE